MTIREQAEYHRILLAMGVERREDIIQWADQLLLHGTVPVEVIDVSLAANAKDHEVDSLLKAVPGDGDLSRAAHAALARFRVVLHDLALKEAVVKVVAYGNTASVPEHERYDATLFDILYEEMLAGHCGSEEELWQMLDDFAKSPCGGGGGGITSRWSGPRRRDTSSGREEGGETGTQRRSYCSLHLPSMGRRARVSDRLLARPPLLKIRFRVHS
jgi:hypothetical protein